MDQVILSEIKTNGLHDKEHSRSIGTMVFNCKKSTSRRMIGNGDNSILEKWKELHIYLHGALKFTKNL